MSNVKCITSGGLVVIGENMPSSMLHEVVDVCVSEQQKLKGEIIKLNGQGEVTIQMLETTDGMSVGDKIENSGECLSVELGPGLLGRMFDGFQRDLSKSEMGIIANGGLDRTVLWEFQLRNVPVNFNIGDEIREGQVYGQVQETVVLLHKLMLPPGQNGKIVWLAVEGKYTLNDRVIEIEDEQHRLHPFTMLQRWPIRKPRPVLEQVESDEPLITGRRIFDGLFPASLGCTIMLPSVWGCGKNTHIFSTSKHGNIDACIHVCCGLRGNEMVEVFDSIQNVTIANRGDASLLDRSCLIANTANMCMACEASIYTGLTIGEYYRDLGYNVLVIVDSMSRWAESILDISYRLGEMPGDAGYPAYISERLQRFHDRASKVQTLGSSTGSVTMMSTVAFYEDCEHHPAFVSAWKTSQVFWALDKRLAQRKHFPEVSWTLSYSQCKRTLQKFYQCHDIYDEFMQLRGEIQTLLKREEDLADSVRRQGKDSLPELDQWTLECAKMVREGFLQQNLFTSYDRYCPLSKTYCLMQVFVDFFHEGEKEMAGKKTFQALNTKLKEIGLITKMERAKFVEAEQLGEQQTIQTYAHLRKEIREALQSPFN